MAKHTGSGCVCEGQAGLRQEGEGSAIKGNSVFKKAVAFSIGSILSGTVALSLYRDVLENSSEWFKERPPIIEYVEVTEDEYIGLGDRGFVIPDLDDQEDRDEDFHDRDDEPHLHVEKYSYTRPGISDSSYSDGDSMKGRKASILVGEFKPVEEENDQFVLDLIGKRFQKNMMKGLNKRGVRARKLDDALEERFYTRDDLKKNPEILYNLSADGIIEGKYELVESGDSDDGEVEMKIDLVYASWGNKGSSTGFGLRIYETSGDLCHTDKMVICLAKKVVGEKISPATTSHGRMVVFVVFELTISR